MKPYNDKVTVFGTPDNLTTKVWARKLYEEAQKDSIFNKLKHYSVPVTFTKRDIKRWWDQKKFDEISTDFNYRNPAKK